MKLYPFLAGAAVMGIYQLCPKILPHLVLGVSVFIGCALVGLAVDAIKARRKP